MARKTAGYNDVFDSLLVGSDRDRVVLIGFFGLWRKANRAANGIESRNE
jgi:hypothetical protein